MTPTAPVLITTERLDLIPMTPAFLAACLARDWDAAEQALPLSIPADWYDEQDLMALRLAQMREDPSLQPWLLRAIGLREAQVMIGHLGFHTAPDPDYLREIAPGAVEFGYTIFPPYRRQGYAYEAAQALMQWARTTHGITRFVLSIAPDNEPSLRLAAKLGFERIGEHVDAEDGLEYIFATGA